jgi:UDPglucose 6-dehydrogenase
VGSTITIGYAGMTHLGINYAVAGAGKGFKIIGYDPKPELALELAAGKLPVVEPGLDEALQQRAQLMQFTANVNDLAACDIVYVAPDVATNDNGQSDLTYINELIAKVIPALNPHALLIILAQVPPGFTRKINFAAHRLYYQVETLIFGQALHRAECPERYIVGCANPDMPLDSRLNTYLQAFNCPILPMRYESAELAKIAINCCLVAAVSVANSLGELCENIGADWNEIVPALRLDKRIGEYAYLQTGLGLSGGNLERDLATVVNLAAEYGTDKAVIQSFRDNSSHRRNWPLNKLFDSILLHNPKAKIALWGLTYKENTHSLKNSPAIKLVRDLAGYTIHAFDPVVKALGNIGNVQFYDSAMAALDSADVLVIMTPWSEFKLADLGQIAQRMRNKVIIDPFKVFSAEQVKALNFEYITTGK